LLRANEALQAIKMAKDKAAFLKDIKEIETAISWSDFANKARKTSSAALAVYDAFCGRNVSGLTLFMAAKTFGDRVADLFKWIFKTITVLDPGGKKLAWLSEVFSPISNVITVINGLYKAWTEKAKIALDMATAKKNYDDRKLEYRAAVENARKAVDLLAYCNTRSTDPTFIGPPPPPPQVRPAGNQPVRNATSFDPNDKIGPGGSGTGVFIQPGPMAYEIEFENSPQFATAAAQEVFITDELDNDLDLETFQFTGFGFGSHRYDVPAGLSHYQRTIDLRAEGIDFLVPVLLDLNKATRQVSMTFRTLDPLTLQLPDGFDGFLPINNANHDGEGYVRYQVQPKAALPSGTQITNKAAIVFDVNKEIPTPTTVHTLDVAGPASRVAALPAASQATFTVNWSGADDAGGSGIARYDVLVADNGGPFSQFQTDTAQTSATFAGQPGHSYAFYSIARDNVGHLEAPPTAADATTTVALPKAPAAALKAASVTRAGGKLYTLQVTYTSSLRIAAATIGTGDLLVTGPRPYTYKPKLVKKTPATNAGKIVATYSLVPPGGSWDARDKGTYSVKLLPNQVHNTSGTPAASRTLGKFTVKIASRSSRARALSDDVLIRQMPPASAIWAGPAPAGTATASFSSRPIPATGQSDDILAPVDEDVL
jgi:hypothetical protein